MSTVSFPSNPSNGMLFEAVPGLVYKYDSGSNCWVRIEGLGSVGLATPLTDGLMSKEDFKKVQNLIIPPPRTTLTGEECGNTVFGGGVVALQSDDNSISITDKPDVINQVGGQTVGGPTPWDLHENTVGYDFTIPLQDLVKKIEEMGLLSRVQIQGKQGPRGETGDPGIDKLDTGPVGPQGESGVNSPFGGTLTAESVPLERVSQENRAIVDISTEETDAGSFLVVTRANIGNPDACPSLVIPEELRSSLLVVLNELDAKLIRNESVSANDCALICRICASTLHHLDIDPILQEVLEHFQLRLQRLKLAKEELVRYWLQVMIALFNEQKAALCCALENCRSRNRNERTRQYVETQRIQAAQANYRLNISSDEADRVKTDLDFYKNCPVPISPDQNVFDIPGGIRFVLDSRIHIVDPRTGNTAQSLKAFLPAGEYVVEITGCCANFNQSAAGNQYSGRAVLLYQSQNSPIVTQPIMFPDFGLFNSEQEARNAYNGLTLSFNHEGGNVSAWLIDPDGFVENNNGTVTIDIVDKDTLLETTFPVGASTVYVYRNEVALDTLIGSISTYSTELTAEQNFNLDEDQNINLVQGPSLIEDCVATFFFNGLDGLSIFFVAGANPYFNTAGVNQNETKAEIEIRISIVNNTVPVNVRVVKGNVTKLSSTEFVARLSLNGDAAGFALGEIDGNSDYAITVTPVNLDSMRTWRAIGPSDNLLLAEGSTDGIGAGTVEVRQGGTVSLFDVSSGVPENFGGPDGFQVQTSIKQDVFLDRPIGITVVNERPVSVDDPRDIFSTPDDPEFALAPPEDPVVPDTDVPSTPAPPTATPPSVPPTPQKPPSESICEIDTSLVPTASMPLPTTGTPGVTSLKGTFGVPERLPAQPTPSSTVISQDPCIVDVVATMQPSSPVSVRYIFTDDDGIKFYSAFVTVPNTSVQSVGQWIRVSLGPPVLSLAPPPEFTDAVLNNQIIDVATVENQLTSEQRQRANSLEGSARLTYIQSILGTPIASLADTNRMVRFELQFQRMPDNASVGFGEIIAIVGQVGSTLEYTIDNFTIIQPPLSEEEPAITATLKRVVAEISGTDTTQAGGILYQDLVSYWGDYTGFDVFWKRGIDFSGNQFYMVNRADKTRLTQAVVNQSNQIETWVDAKTVGGKPWQATTSGIYSPGGIAVDYFGVVYVADGRTGTISTFLASNSLILNTTYGDANTGGATSAIYKFSKDLPKSDTVAAKITLGKVKVGSQGRGGFTQELIVNFDNQWIIVDGGYAPRLVNSPAARADTTTRRCCFGDGPIGQARNIALNTATGQRRVLGNSPGGNSIATDRPINPQPAFPVPSNKVGQQTADAVQAQLDAEFNTFNLYSLTNDGKIYLIDQNNGSRTLFRDLKEPAFGLKCNPRTKDLYYITMDRTDFSNNFPSGTRIKYVDLDDLDDEDRPKIKTVWIRESEKQGIFAIEFGNTVPADPTRSRNALYALLSTAERPNSGKSVTTKVVEIAEIGTNFLAPGPEPTKSPTNSVWNGSGTGGINPSGPGSNGNPIIFSRVPPGAGCQMYHKQIEWYERGWRIGACCGALVEYEDAYWLVVKRSIGTDLSCGGGESENTPCIRQYIDSGEGHPAIAWPTNMPPVDPEEPGGGGHEFLGRPTSGFVNLMKDPELSNALLSRIRSGSAKKVIGSPGTEIPFILFPST